MLVVLEFNFHLNADLFLIFATNTFREYLGDLRGDHGDGASTKIIIKYSCLELINIAGFGTSDLIAGGY